MSFSSSFFLSLEILLGLVILDFPLYIIPSSSLVFRGSLVKSGWMHFPVIPLYLPTDYLVNIMNLFFFKITNKFQRLKGLLLPTPKKFLYLSTFNSYRAKNGKKRHRKNSSLLSFLSFLCFCPPFFFYCFRVWGAGLMIDTL